MLLKITLWGLLIGSIVMGVLGYQAESATTAIVGIGVIIFIAFLLFFLIRSGIAVALVLGKILLIVGIISIIGFLGFKGCQYAMQKGQAISQELPSTTKLMPKLTNHSDEPSILDKIVDTFFSSSDEVIAPEKKSVETIQIPSSINGVVSEVRSGVSFVIQGNYIKLLGVDAPDLSQTCISQRQETYPCGYRAKQKLKQLILNKHLECSIVNQIGPKAYLGTCVLENYDVGATMISVGWGIAERHVSDIYIPYEEKAHKAKQGLWAGHFVAPWEYRKSTSHATTQQQEGFLKGLFQ